MMEKISRFAIIATLGFVGAIFQPALAEETTATPAPTTAQPWEKFGVNIGVFAADTNSSARIGSGLGVDLDLEKLLGMESKTTAFRVDADWRFSDNRRHRLDVSWFALHRTAKRDVGQDFEITKPDGSQQTVNAGTSVESHFDLDIIQTAYSYSFFQDDRADLAVVGGLYVMPINLGFSAADTIHTEGTLKFTAPLPVLGFRMDFAVTPKWFLRTGSEIFYVQYQGFTGKLIDTRAAVEYLPFKHVGFGVGYDALRASFDGAGKDYPYIDLNGSLAFQYTGLQVYGKYFF